MNRLKMLRDEKGLFQNDIAKFLGVSSSAVGFYETEKRDMSPDTIIKLADYFGVSTDYLLGKSDIRNPESITIDIDEADIAFASGFKGLNETNKMIIKNTIEGLLAKQEQDKKDTKE